MLFHYAAATLMRQIAADVIHADATRSYMLRLRSARCAYAPRSDKVRAALRERQRAARARAMPLRACGAMRAAFASSQRRRAPAYDLPRFIPARAECSAPRVYVTLPALRCARADVAFIFAARLFRATPLRYCCAMLRFLKIYLITLIAITRCADIDLMLAADAAADIIFRLLRCHWLPSLPLCVSPLIAYAIFSFADFSAIIYLLLPLLPSLLH